MLQCKCIIYLNTVKILGKTTGRLWNYYRDELSNPLSSNSESFKYKTYIVGKTPENNDSLTNVKLVISLKYLSNFWKSLNIPLINCEVELILTWSKNCVLVDMTERDAEGDNPAIVAPTGLEFKITDTKLYVPVVSLSKENDIKLLEQLKSRFKRTIKWNKYRSQMTIQLQNNNLNYLIDPTFTDVHRLFVLPFQRTAGQNNTTKDYRDSFSHYCVPNIRIKDFNVLIGGKSFFDLLVKNEEEAYEKIAYFKENYKLLANDLSKQTKLKDPQQINFIGKLDKANRATMFFIIEKSKETIF